MKSGRSFKSRLRRGYSGAIVIALLLASALNGVLVAARQIVAAIILHGINSILRSLRYFESLRDVTPLNVPDYVLHVNIMIALESVALGAAALGIAFWLYAPDPAQPQQPES